MRQLSIVRDYAQQWGFKSNWGIVGDYAPIEGGLNRRFKPLGLTWSFGHGDRPRPRVLDSV